MIGSIRMNLLLATTLIAACAVDSHDIEQGDLTTTTAYDGLTSGSGSGGGSGSGSGAIVKYRGGGTVKSCIAGPAGVLLPNRFVSCYCEQLVKDCGQDNTCMTCSNARYEQCASTTWFSSLSYLSGDCNVSELNECEQYCQQNCSGSCG